MFDELIDGLVMGAAAGAASTWAGHKMTPTPGIPIWTGAVGDTAMTLMRETSGRRTHYELWVVELGQAAVQVGRYPVYPDAVAAIGQWGKYLHGGGTIASWRVSQRPTQTAITPLTLET
jgi:hypothetical protein